MVICIKINLSCTSLSDNTVAALMMNYRLAALFFLLLITGGQLHAQKPFTEGVIIYKVKLETPEHKEYRGTYAYTFKGTLVRKDLKLSNGYEDIVLYDCSNNSIYSLQNKGSKKYAIQLSMDDFLRDQQKFSGFTMKNETDERKKIAGYDVTKGDVNYTDGTFSSIRFTKEWCPSQIVTFERFPNAKFFPLYFSYTDEKGMTMTFEASKIEAQPVENAVFRIPADYKIISYNEYKEMSN